MSPQSRTELSAAFLGAVLALAAIVSLTCLGVDPPSAIWAVLVALLVIGVIRLATTLIRRHRGSR